MDESGLRRSQKVIDASSFLSSEWPRGAAETAIGRGSPRTDGLPPGMGKRVGSRIQTTDPTTSQNNWFNVFIFLFISFGVFTYYHHKSQLTQEIELYLYKSTENTGN